MNLLYTTTVAFMTLSAAAAFAGTDSETNDEAAQSGQLMIAETDANQSPLPMPQDTDASIVKAKPADEMVGDTAPNGTDLDVDPDSATADGVPRDAESAFVNTEKEEAEVGIPDSD